MPEIVKTTVSLERELFNQTEALAGRLQVSRSRVVSLALRNFLMQDENRRLLDQLNKDDVKQQLASHAQ